MRSSGLSVAWFSLVMSTHSFWQRCSPAPITRPEVPVCSVGLLGTPGCISWSDISTLDRKHMRQFDAVKGQGSVKSFFLLLLFLFQTGISHQIFSAIATEQSAKSQTAISAVAGPCWGWATGVKWHWPEDFGRDTRGILWERSFVWSISRVVCSLCLSFGWISSWNSVPPFCTRSGGG